MMNKKSISHTIQNKKIAVCCLARDCAKLMKSNIMRINALHNHCGEMVVFVVENDSKDNTRALLEQWKNNAPFDIHIPNIYEYKKTRTDVNIDCSASEKNMSWTSLYTTRVARIALARDCYLDALKKSGFIPDFIVMCDIDIYHFSIYDIIQTIASHGAGDILSDNQRGTWDVVLANGFNFHFSRLNMEELYYDSFATELLGEPSKAHDIKVHLQKSVSKILYSGAWLRVVSGFGGLGIYTYDAIFSPSLTLYIDSIIIDDYQFCEHVSFHKMLIQKGKDKIYINPHLKVRYNTRLRAVIKRILQRLKLKG